MIINLEYFLHHNTSAHVNCKLVTSFGKGSIQYKLRTTLRVCVRGCSTRVDIPTQLINMMNGLLIYSYLLHVHIVLLAAVNY